MAVPTTQQMVDALTTAIYELTVNKVAQYQMFGRVVAYHDVAKLRGELQFWEQRLARESAGGDLRSVASFGPSP